MEAALKQQTFVDAGIALLDTEQPQPLTVTNVVHKAGTDRNAFYRQFESLDALVGAILIQIFQEGDVSSKKDDVLVHFFERINSRQVLCQNFFAYRTRFETTFQQVLTSRLLTRWLKSKDTATQTLYYAVLVGAVDCWLSAPQTISMTDCLDYMRNLPLLDLGAIKYPQRQANCDDA